MFQPREQALPCESRFGFNPLFSIRLANSQHLNNDDSAVNRFPIAREKVGLKLFLRILILAAWAAELPLDSP